MENVNEIETQGTEISTDAIAAALAATRNKVNNATEVEKPKRAKLTDEERAARTAQRNEERAARKAVRDEERAKERAARELAKASRVPHMSKVDKAASKLPKLSDSATEAVNNLVQNFGSSDITAIVAHLTHRQRAAATTAALSAKLEVGQTVRIVSADGSAAHYIGHLAKVVAVQRIRCYVTPVGAPQSKRVYLFNSDCQAISDDELETVNQSETVQDIAEAV